jgi:hypothetical protein
VTVRAPILTVLLCAAFPAQSLAAGPCPATIPNGTSPPGQQFGPGSHGNGFIWTGLPRDGVLRARPPGSPSPVLRADGTVGMKFLWRTLRPAMHLKVKGKRLNGRARRFRQTITRFDAPTTTFPSGIVFPTVGCWRMTAKGGANEALTFVVSVVKASQPARRTSS